MNIYLKSSGETRAYLPLVMKALRDAGHTVRYDAIVRNDATGVEGCDICIELSAGGLHHLREQRESSLAVVRHKTDFRIEKLVLVIGKASLPRRAIVDGLNLKQKSRAFFINNYLKPAVEKGFVTMTNPAHPNLPEQSYRLTANGLDLYDALTKVPE